MPCEHVQRKIDAILSKIDNHVLPEIGELQRGACSVGQRLALLIAIAAETQHQPSHRIGGIAAILEQLVEITVAGHGLVVFEGLDQIVEEVLRKFMPRPCLSARRRPDGRPARVHGLQFGPPPRQQPQALLGVADLVRPDRPPSGRRNRRYRSPGAAAWEQEAHDLKILVVVRREPARVGERPVERPVALHRFRERPKRAARSTRPGPYSRG